MVGKEDSKRWRSCTFVKLIISHNINVLEVDKSRCFLYEAGGRFYSLSCYGSGIKWGT
jgi:hypothetical protein